MHGYRAGLAEMVRGSEFLARIEPGCRQYVSVPLGGSESVTCVTSGCWLVRDDDGPLVAMLKSADHGMGESLELEVIAPIQPAQWRAGAPAELWRLMARAQRVPRTGPRAALAALPRGRGSAADGTHPSVDPARGDRPARRGLGADRAPGVWDRRARRAPAGERRPPPARAAPAPGRRGRARRSPPCTSRPRCRTARL